MLFSNAQFDCSLKLQLNPSNEWVAKFHVPSQERLFLKHQNCKMLGLCIGWLYMLRYLGPNACCQTRGSNPLWQAEMKLLLTAEIKILIITSALLCTDPAGEHPTMRSVSATYLEVNESWGLCSTGRMFSSFQHWAQACLHNRNSGYTFSGKFALLWRWGQT